MRLSACFVIVAACSVPSFAAPAAQYDSNYATVDVNLLQDNPARPGVRFYEVQITSKDPPPGFPSQQTAVNLLTANLQSEVVSSIILRNCSGEAQGRPQTQLYVTVVSSAGSGASYGEIGDVVLDEAYGRDVLLATLNAFGTLGNVRVPKIGSIVVGGSPGDLVGDVVALSWPGGNSNVGRVDVKGGIFGNIVAQYGLIGDVKANRDITARSATPPVYPPIGPVNIYARDTIQSVTSTTGMIWANIDANAYNSTGRLGSVAGSSFKGSIRATGFYGSNGGDLNRISIDNDLQGDITLTGAALGYQIDTGAQQKQYIRIGKSFVSGTIQVPALNANPALGGIAPLGQILVGANVASASPAWTGTVNVGSTTLSPTPAYTPTAASIGGGAAGFPGLVVAGGGRAGYDLHATSCFPVPNAVFAIRKMQVNGLGADPQCVDVPFTPRLRFYGPVERTTPSPLDTDYVASTVNVLAWNGSTYTAASGTFGTPDTVSANNYREFAVNNAGAWGVGKYRLTRKDGALKCRDVDGVVSGTQDVAKFALDFELVDVCDLQMIQYFDRNGDQVLDGADVAAQVVDPVDFNLDGSADSRDMWLLLQAVSRYGR